MKSSTTKYATRKKQISVKTNLSNKWNNHPE
jgi:hypothetical protein